MSAFTHACCPSCWLKRNPGRAPSVVLGAPVEACCVCGELTNAGIYFREVPTMLRCQGRHKEQG